MPLSVSLTESIKPFLPEAIICMTIAYVLISDLFTTLTKRSLNAAWAIVGLVAAFALEIPLAVDPISLGDKLFMGGMMRLDHLAVYFKCIFLLTGLVIIIYDLETPQIDFHVSGEHVILLLSMILGMMLLVSSTHLLMIYLSFEAMSLASYLLVALYPDRKDSSESALKYVIFGGASSAVMLYGFSLLYGLTGQMELSAITHAFLNQPHPAYLVIFLSMALILVGIGFKISMVPFHFWAPDVYQGGPTSITAILSVASKAAGFFLLLRVMFTLYVNGAQSLVGHFAWEQVFFWTSILTMTFGNFIALFQKSMKRMLAYSSIAQAGYMLMSVQILNHEGSFAIVFYLTVYTIMNLGAFLAVMIVEDRMGSDRLEEWKGVGWQLPLVGVSLGICLFSLAGVPPLAGFVGKFYIFKSVLAAAEKGHPMLYLLAIIGLLNSLVSVYYYTKPLKVIFLEDLPSAFKMRKLPEVPTIYRMTLALLAVLIVGLGLFWRPLIWAVNYSLQ